MAKYDAVEAALERLVPRALSEAAQDDIEAMIDDLAGGVEIPADARRDPWLWRAAFGGIAAAVAVGLWLAPHWISGPKSSIPVAAVDSELNLDVVLVGESERVKSMTDEGWSEDVDGVAMRAMRLSVIEEDRFRDEETGIVVLVSEPREEILLMPVNTF